MAFYKILAAVTIPPIFLVYVGLFREYYAPNQHDYLNVFEISFENATTVITFSK